MMEGFGRSGKVRTRAGDAQDTHRPTLFHNTGVIGFDWMSKA